MAQSRRFRSLAILAPVALAALVGGSAEARNPYRTAFFNIYPQALGTRLATLPSAPNHCGGCHFQFGGAGPRNDYGVAVGDGIQQYGNATAAINAIAGLDSDSDGYSSLTEITDQGTYANTPTFPGLRDDDLGQVSGVNTADLVGYLVPTVGVDTDPPAVLVVQPAGGELVVPQTLVVVSWQADDPSGIIDVAVDASFDGGASFKPMARNLPDTGSWSWFVPNRPGAAVIRVTARDGAGNLGSDDSAGFTVTTLAGGVVPTTMRDFDLPGSQPFEAGELANPSTMCSSCHGNFQPTTEPWHNWLGGMMSQAMRDPLYLATLVIAEQDAPSVGDLCLRCHSPGGWLEGHSNDTSGGMMNAKDRFSVQCDFCHRLVDPVYVAGTSPARDEDILAAITAVPPASANGMFVVDPDAYRRGPYADAVAPHEVLQSPFHRSAALCGTCHDVSNPVFVQAGDPATYVPGDLDAPHPDADLRNMFPVERTYSEYTLTEYATVGVYAPQFAGARPDGMVSTCQDCHMPDVVGQGAVDGPVRNDLAKHDLTGGNHFVPDILAEYFPDEIDPVALQDGKARVTAMLQLAATLTADLAMVENQPQLSVTVVNETAHKLPSGYPEGRRIWLNVKAYDGSDALIYESGAYDAATGVLTHDPAVKIYETKPGISHRLAAVLGVTAGPSFHFALGDTIWKDNRIPPRGFVNAAFAAAQCAPVGAVYADGQHHDLVTYVLPTAARRATVTLYYQSTSKEYIEFLRDENTTNDLGEQLYQSWVAQGRAAPVAMATTSAELDLSPAPDAPLPTALLPAAPHPCNPATTLLFRLPANGPVDLAIFDPAGRRVRTLVVGPWAAGEHAVRWDGRDQRGRGVAAGSYLAVLTVDGVRQTTKLALVK